MITHTVLLCAVFLVCGDLRIFCLDFRVRVEAPMESNATADLMRRRSGDNAGDEATVSTDEASLTCPPAHLLF